MGDLGVREQAAHPLAVEVEQRRLKALELRAQGRPYRAIAVDMGISRARAYELVREALDDITQQSKETAEQVREIELDRLDDLHERLTMKLRLQRRKVMNKDNVEVMVPDPSEKTVDSLLRVAEHRARLLGIYAPTEIVGAGGGAIQVSNVAASEEFMGKVEKMIARLEAGESPEQVAASIRATAVVVEEGKQSTNGNGSAP